MEKSLEQLLRAHGPGLSSSLVKRLVEGGASPAAARQRISRAGPNIKRLLGISFPNREKFLFLENEFGKQLFLENLEKALLETNSSYGRAIQALRSRGGVMYESFFPIGSGLPIKNTKGHLLHEGVIAPLIQVKLLKSIDSTNAKLVQLWDSEGLTKHRHAVMLAEDILLSSIKEWLIKLGWSSPGKLKIRRLKEGLPEFGQFAWDFTGPCYLAAVKKFKGDKLVNGFIVGDILLDRKVSTQDLRPYFSKWDILKNQHRDAVFQPVIIASSFEADALKELRARGAFIAIPETVFGREAARDLASLVGLVENAAAAVAKDPEKIFDLFSKISKIEGASLNLRGVLIEMVVAHWFKLKGYSIDIREQVTTEIGIAEIDVRAVTASEIVCCECKGKAPGGLVGKSEIEDWLDRSLPRIKRSLSNWGGTQRKIRFEFYSSTGYTEAALELIKEVESQHNKQPIKFLTGADLLAKLRAENQHSLVQIYTEQFT